MLGTYNNNWQLNGCHGDPTNIMIQCLIVYSWRSCMWTSITVTHFVYRALNTTGRVQTYIHILYIGGYIIIYCMHVPIRLAAEPQVE